jgi:serine protease Do
MTTRFLLLCLALLSLPAAADGSLWVELKARDKKPIKIPSVAPLVERSQSAVLVVISETDTPPDLPPGHPAMPPGSPMMEGQGSGFLIHPSGLALTNHHVIENARVIKVRVGRERREHRARVVGTDQKTDVALIEIVSDKKDWPALPLGKTEQLKVGDFLVAIGNPFGLANSVSMGILSGRGRRDVAPSGRGGLYDFLQTDASINFGNSGGPLLNLAGEVVGINTAINAAAQGIGFAIPIDMVKSMLPALRKDGRIVRSWIGVGIQEVSPELAKSVGMRRPRGALIQRVLEDGPAAGGGIVPGDIIVTFDGHDIEAASELPLYAGDAGVGRSVSVSLWRDGAPMTVKVTLGAHPDNKKKAAADKKEPEKRKAELGVSVVTLDDDDRARLGIDKKQEGARVVKVKMGSAAFSAGLRPDDVVQRVGGEKIKGAKDFAKMVKATERGGVLRLFVLRDGTSLFVALTRP